MKTILVDAIHAFVIDKVGIYEPMLELLEEYPNRKIVITGANKKDFKNRGLGNIPYDLFTLEGQPKKADPRYYKLLLEHFNLTTDDVIYFEHNKDAIKSAESLGIKTYYYDPNKKDLRKLKEFLDTNLK